MDGVMSFYSAEGNAAHRALLFVLSVSTIKKNPRDQGVRCAHVWSEGVPGMLALGLAA